MENKMKPPALVLAGRLLQFGLALGFAGGLSADQSNNGLADTAAAWLNIPTDARAAAMGGAGAALAGGVDSMQSNPASLSLLGSQQAALLHDSGLQGTNLEHLGYGVPLGTQSGLGATVDYLSYGSIATYNVVAGQAQAGSAAINPYAYDVNVGYGMEFGGLGAGATVKMLGQSLPGDSSSAFAVDLGARWGTADTGFGLALQNLGSELDGAVLPANVKLGGAVSGGDAAPLPWTLAADVNLPAADLNEYSVDFGGELRIAGELALRVGYSVADRGQLSGVGGLSAGLGLTYRWAVLNYALLTEGDLGDSNLLSLDVSF
jgi:hypothetical protein